MKTHKHHTWHFVRIQYLHSRFKSTWACPCGLTKTVPITDRDKP